MMIETCCILVGVAIALDVLSGFLGAWFRGEISSAKMRIGAMHKIGEVLIVVLCVYVDYAQGLLDLSVTIPTLKASTVYLVGMELFSIAENIGKMNPDLCAAPIFKKLQALKDGEPKA
jgi:phage-related holin